MAPESPPVLPTLSLSLIKYYTGINVGTVGSVFLGGFWGRFRPETPNHVTHGHPGGVWVAPRCRFGKSDFSKNEGPLQRNAVSSKKPAGGYLFCLFHAFPWPAQGLIWQDPGPTNWTSVLQQVTFLQLAWKCPQARNENKHQHEHRNDSGLDPLPAARKSSTRSRCKHCLSALTLAITAAER